MDRRDFVKGSTAALFLALLGRPSKDLVSLVRDANAAEVDVRPEITAAVDVIVPPDPDVPGDFKGSDYGADAIVAAAIGDLGQAAMVAVLNRYARQVASGKKFLECDDAERLEAIRAWVSERDTADDMTRDLLKGLVSFAVAGTYEENTPEEQAVIFEAMGWFDPADPAGTFRVPNTGYVDSFIFPAALKKGVRR